MHSLDALATQYSALALKIQSAACSSYSFVDNAQFGNLLASRDFKTANHIYIREILFRFHAASLITLRRNQSWLNSIEAAKRSGAFFGFCASLRGLIESSADSFHSLRFAPQNLAEYFSILQKGLRGELDDRLHLFQELEDWGLHFMEAGKYDDGTRNKTHYKAQMTWEYLKSLNSEAAQKLYEFLCQITHPSRESTYFYFRENSVGWSVEAADEPGSIRTIEENNHAAWEDIFQLSYNGALITLWVLDKMDIPGLMCPAIRQFDFSSISEFEKVAVKMKGSQ